MENIGIVIQPTDIEDLKNMNDSIKMALKAIYKYGTSDIVAVEALKLIDKKMCQSISMSNVSVNMIKDD